MKLTKTICFRSLVLAPIIMLVYCNTPAKLNKFDLTSNYKVDDFQNEIGISFESINDSISKAIIQINPNNLLFSKSDAENYVARYTIGYKIFKSYDNKEPIDTGKTLFSLHHLTIKKTKLHHLKFIAPIGNDYEIQITLKDENRNQTTSKTRTHRKKTITDRSYFKIRGTKQETTNHTLFQKDSFCLTPSNNFKSPIKVMTFAYKSSCAAKPYNVTYSHRFEKTPDSSWILSNKSSYTLPPLKNGYYHFITDTSTNDGFSVFSLNKSFPMVNSIKDANCALGYLLNKSDYIELLRSSNQRKSFEKNWLILAGNRNRARNLIKDYYSEVSKANKLFTNIELGCNTDRGMIYIIYGAPKIVYRSKNSERWIYRDGNNLFTEEFEFKKIKTDLADEVYELKRNINFKTSFNRMVDVWIDDRGY